MAVYRGVVRGNTIVLDAQAGLAEGTVVEVRPVAPPAAVQEEPAREVSFLRTLLDSGVIRAIPPRLPDPPGLDRTPLRVDGPPVSQTLLEERR
jgi:hypothetical protein